MIEAKIIKDSVNTNGERITTWVLKYPRFIHSEFMTHRVFSRNAASSRAIPAKKLIEAVIEEPAMPVWWGKNEPGMQANAQLSTDITEKLVGPSGPAYYSPMELARQEWLKGRDRAVETAKQLLLLGLHKQVANRVLEPWCHMTVVATCTEYENFFSLRAHKDAQPEFQELAYKMLGVYNGNEPDKLGVNEWHIPFSDRMPDVNLETQLKIATARCARVSYLTFDNEIDVAKDIELHDRLSGSGHWSPFEHCAQSAPGTFSGNYRGWAQYRKTHFSHKENGKDSRLVKR